MSFASLSSKLSNLKVILGTPKLATGILSEGDLVQTVPLNFTVGYFHVIVK